ncbi:hypothetical protein HK098_006697 [Nowakowskiella sp. JEL0407]|nr:hypothetical protein HK098_006697 [Nowakowskiella sp. JEL0407]
MAIGQPDNMEKFFKNSANGRLLHLTILCIFEAILFISTIVFFAKRKSPSIKVKGVGLTVSHAIVSMVLTPVMILRNTYAAEYPCFLIFWGLNFLVPLWTLFLVSRGYWFYKLFKFHESSGGKYTPDKSGKTRDQDSVFSFSMIPAPLRLESGTLAFQEGEWQFISRSAILKRKLRYTLILISMALFVYSLIIQLTFPPIAVLPKLELGIDCTFRKNWMGQVQYAIVGFFLVIVAPTMVFMLRKIRDTQGIQRELLVSIVVDWVCLVIYFMISYQMLPIDDWGYFGPNHVIYIVCGSCHYMSVILPLYTLYMNERKKSKFSLAYNMDSFNQVFADESLFHLLKIAAAKDLCSEQIIFLEEVEILKKRAELQANHFQNLNTSPQIETLTTKASTPDNSSSVYAISTETSTDYSEPVPSNYEGERRKSKYDYNLFQQRTVMNSSEFLQPPQHRFLDQSSQNSDGHSGFTSEVTVEVMSAGNTNSAISLHCERLMRAFIYEGAPLEVNLSASVRYALIDKFNDGYIGVNMFDDAKEEVKNSLVGEF